MYIYIYILHYVYIYMYICPGLGDIGVQVADVQGREPAGVRSPESKIIINKYQYHNIYIYICLSAVNYIQLGRAKLVLYLLLVPNECHDIYDTRKSTSSSNT